MSASDVAGSGPYKGLAPFGDSELDALLFFGREREREIVVANLIASRLTVLYGPSGVGKSSLLRAGVARELRALPEQPLVVTFADWSEEPALALSGALAEAAGVSPADTLVETVAAAVQRHGDVYLILDQLEEYFLYHAGENGPGTFADELPALLAQPLRVNVLLSLREDALARLDRFKGRIPNLFGNYLRLDRLDRMAGIAAIVRPVERWNQLEGEAVEVEPALVDAVLDDVGAGRISLGIGGLGATETNRQPASIEAPYLQLVMQRLWDVERGARSNRLQARTLEQLGGAQQIVADHLEGAIDALTPAERNVAARLFNHLVTPSGTKIAHDLADLAEYAGVAEEAIRPVVAALADRRILRPDDAGRYEIFHDVLAGAVLGWRARYEGEQAVESARDEARRRHRRLAFLTGAALAAVAAMAAVTVFALTQRSDARQQTKRARARELDATALSLLPTDPELGLVLAVDSAQASPTREAEDVLRQALVQSHERRVLRAGGPVRTAVYSRDGARVLTGSDDGLARLYDAASGRVLRTLEQRGPVMAASFSPDDRLVVTAGGDGTAKIWSTGGGALLRTLHHRGPVTAAWFAAGGDLVVTASDDGTARIWRARNGRLVRTVAHSGGVRAVTLSSDGKLLATVAADPAGHLGAFVFSARTGRRLYALPEKGVTGVLFSPDGRLLVTTSTDKTARIWNARTGALLQTLDHLGHVVGASFSRDGKLLATASEDGLGRVWDVATGNRELILVGPIGFVESASFSPDGKSVVVSSFDRTARVYEADNGRPLAVLAGHTDGVTSASFAPDGRSIVTASVDGTARIWDPGTEPELVPLAENLGVVRSAALSPDGTTAVAASDAGVSLVRLAGRRRLLAPAAAASAAFSLDGKLVVSAGDDGTARLFSAATGTPLRVFDQGGRLTRAAFSPNAALLVTAGSDRTARLWATDSGTELHVFRQGGTVADAAFSQDGALVVTAGTDRTARVWDVGSGALLHVLRGHTGPLMRASFSADGTLVLTASADDTARLWSTRTGKLLHVLRGHTAALTDAEFDASGELVVTASLDHDARIWDARTGHLLHVLRAHFSTVNAASFSPDGRWVITAGPTTAGLWETTTGRLLFYLRGHSAIVTAASFGPDGKRVLTGSEDGSVRTYVCDVCPGIDDLLALARERLARTGRTLTPAEQKRYLG